MMKWIVTAVLATIVVVGPCQTGPAAAASPSRNDVAHAVTGNATSTDISAHRRRYHHAYRYGYPQYRYGYRHYNRPYYPRYYARPYYYEPAPYYAPAPVFPFGFGFGFGRW